MPIHKLGVAVEESGVKQTEAEINRLAQSVAKVGSAADGVGEHAKRAAQEQGNAIKGVIESNKKLEASIESVDDAARESHMRRQRELQESRKQREAEAAARRKEAASTPRPGGTTPRPAPGPATPRGAPAPGQQRAPTRAEMLEQSRRDAEARKAAAQAAEDARLAEAKSQVRAQKINLVPVDGDAAKDMAAQATGAQDLATGALQAARAVEELARAEKELKEAQQAADRAEARARLEFASAHAEVAAASLKEEPEFHREQNAATKAMIDRDPGGYGARVEAAQALHGLERDAALLVAEKESLLKQREVHAAKRGQVSEEFWHQTQRSIEAAIAQVEVYQKRVDGLMYKKRPAPPTASLEERATREIEMAARAKKEQDAAQARFAAKASLQNQVAIAEAEKLLAAYRANRDAARAAGQAALEAAERAARATREQREAFDAQVKAIPFKTLQPIQPPPFVRETPESLAASLGTKTRVAKPPTPQGSGSFLAMAEKARAIEAQAAQEQARAAAIARDDGFDFESMAADAAEYDRELDQAEAGSREFAEATKKTAVEVTKLDEGMKLLSPEIERATKRSKGFAQAEREFAHSMNLAAEASDEFTQKQIKQIAINKASEAQRAKKITLDEYNELTHAAAESMRPPPPKAGADEQAAAAAAKAKAKRDAELADENYVRGNKLRETRLRKEQELNKVMAERAAKGAYLEEEHEAGRALIGVNAEIAAEFKEQIKLAQKLTAEIEELAQAEQDRIQKAWKNPRTMRPLASMGVGADPEPGEALKAGKLAEARQRGARAAQQLTIEERNAKLAAQLGNEATLEQIRLHNRLQAELKETTAVQRTLGQTMKAGWQSFGAFIGPFSAGLQTGISAAWYLKGILDIIKQGGLANEINKVTESLGGLNKARAISDASGGLMGARAAQQAEFRGASMGFRGGEGVDVARIAKAAAQFRVMTGEADDLATAMTEAMKGAQDEIRAGNIGETLKAAGVHQATYNQQLARAAAQRGVLVESLDAQTRASLLLSQASDDATGRLTNLRMKGLEGVAELENFGADLKNKLAAQLAKVGGFDAAAGVDEARARYAQAQIGTAGGNYVDLTGMSGAGGSITNQKEIAAAKAELDAALEASRKAQQNQLKETLLQDVTAGGRQAMQAGGVERLEATRAVLEQIVMLKDQEAMAGEVTAQSAAVYAQGMMNTTAEMIKQAQTSGVINVDAAQLIRSTLERKQVLEVIQKLETEMLPIYAEESTNKANFLKYQIASNKTLTESQKLEMTKKQIQLESLAANLAYAQSEGKTFDEAKAALDNQRTTRIDMLAAQGATLKISEAQSRLLSQDAKDWNEAYVQVNKLRTDMTGLSSLTQTYRMNVGQVAGGELFAKIADHIGLASDKARVFGTILGQAAGLMDGLLGGALLTDKALAWVFKFKPDPKKEPTRGSGRSEDDGLLERLRRERIERDIADAGRVFATQRDYNSQASDLASAFTTKIISEDERRTAATLGLLDKTTAKWKEMYGNGGVMDETTTQSMIELEWWYLDTMKQAGKSAEKRFAVEQAFEDKLKVIRKDSISRYVGDLVLLGERAASTAASVAKSGMDAWGAWRTEFEAMAEAETAMLDERRAKSTRGTTITGADRAMSEAETGLVRQRIAMDREHQRQLDSHRWSAEQKLLIEQEYAARVRDLDNQLGNARVAENKRARDAMIEDSRNLFAETQSIVDKFMGEARSKQEQGQATTAGGAFDKQVEGLVKFTDAVMVGGPAILDWMNEYEATAERMRQGEISAAQAATMGLMGGIAAGAQAAAGMIKSERVKAGVLGAMEAAKSVAAAAELNVPGAIAHGAAAVKFFAIAGSSSGSTVAAAKAEQTKRTALTADVQTFKRDRGPENIIYVQVISEPITGRKQVRSMNGEARLMSGTGTRLDPRLFGGQTGKLSGV